MIYLVENSINTFVFNVIEKSVDNDYVFELENIATNDTYNATFTNIASAESKWLKFTLDLPNDLDLITGQYSFVAKRNDNNNEVYRGIIIVNDNPTETKQYNADAKYKHYKG